MRLGIGHVFLASGMCFVEIISYAGMQPSEGKRRGYKESPKESEKVAKRFHTRRESDDCSFILLASEFGDVGKGANYERDFCGSPREDRRTLS